MLNSANQKTEKLITEFGSDSLHHALIFQGDNIQSVEHQAVLLIRSILEMSEDQFEHPDLFHLRPSGKMRIITADNTRALISELNRSSNQGGCKVALIHEADRMRKEAANAFLKTLEEPPAGTYIILATTKPYSTLPTIRSRCLQVRLPTNNVEIENPLWQEWLSLYESWILQLLDREKLKNDRVSPVFAAYGLIERFVSIIKQIADEEWKKNSKNLPEGVEDKEKDAIETSIRKGIRAQLMKSLIDRSRMLVVNSGLPLEKVAGKLVKVVYFAEKASGLLEVNLKDETAFEYFWLSSLRTWTAK
jgi:DNA polymerase-3 subunit delta'